MRTHQLLAPVVLVPLALVSCTQPETQGTIDRTAQQVRAVAARAGDGLADSWLTTKIQAQYFADDDLEARHINVSTHANAVTLTGVVQHEAQRDLAVQIALMTDGVRQVNDRLAVRSPAGESGAVATAGTLPPAAASSDNGAVDHVVTTRIQAGFFQDDRLKARRITVEARGGVATLSGEVADEGERAQALLLARGTEGVTRVEDLLTVSPERPAPAEAESTPSASADALVTTAIQAKFFVDPLLKGSPVDVSTRAGVVTLHGQVGSDAVRTRALAIARSTPGALQVIDRVTVPTKK